MYARIDFNINNIKQSRKKGLKKIKGNQNKISNQKKITSYGIGLASRSFLQGLQMVTTKVGSYTGNKVQTRNMNTSIKYTGYMITATINPYLAIGKAALDLLENTVDYNIRQINSQQETDYRTSLIGKSSTSNSRWRGNYK